MATIDSINKNLKCFANRVPANGMYLSYLDKACELMDLYGDALSIMEDEKTSANVEKVEGIAEEIERTVGDYNHDTIEKMKKVLDQLNTSMKALDCLSIDLCYAEIESILILIENLYKKILRDLELEYIRMLLPEVEDVLKCKSNEVKIGGIDVPRDDVVKIHDAFMSVLNYQDCILPWDVIPLRLVVADHCYRALQKVLNDYY